MCKYGDFFLKLEASEKYGVYNVIPFAAFNIERQEHYDPENPTAVRFRYDPDGLAADTYGYFKTPNQHDAKSIYFDNYEVAHFRLLTDVNFLPSASSTSSSAVSAPTFEPSSVSSSADSPTSPSAPQSALVAINQ